MAYHDRELMIADLRRLPAKAWEDGVYFDVPKDRRRKQAMGQKPLRINLPPDQRKRLATQLNRYIEFYGKEAGVEVLLLLAEKFTFPLPEEEEESAT